MAVRYHDCTMVAPFQAAEWSKFYRYDDGGGVSALHARFVTHRYPRHSHDYFVVGLVESGAQSYTYKGTRHITSCGKHLCREPGRDSYRRGCKREWVCMQDAMLEREFCRTSHRISGRSAGKRLHQRARPGGRRRLDRGRKVGGVASPPPLIGRMRFTKSNA